MAARRTAMAGLIPLGFQTFSLSNSTAVGLNSTLSEARAIRVSVETQACRIRDDGTDPALTTGVLLATGYHFLEGLTTSGASALKFQRSTGTSKVSILGYKLAGD